MRTFVSRSIQAAVVVLATTCLVTACDSVRGFESSSADNTQKHDYNQAWKCPEGQISEAFLVPLVTDPVTDQGGSSELVFSGNVLGSGNLFEQYEEICLNKEQTASLVRKYLPGLHAGIITQNAKLDQDSVEINRIFASLDAKPDLVAKLFGVIRTVCESGYRLRSEYYNYTYLVDDSSVMIDKIFDAYKVRSKNHLESDQWTYGGDLGPVLAAPNTATFGKKGDIKGVYSRGGEAYLQIWGDAYELFHTDPTYRQLRAGDFPSRDFDKVYEQEC